MYSSEILQRDKSSISNSASRVAEIKTSTTLRLYCRDRQASHVAVQLLVQGSAQLLRLSGVLMRAKVMAP
jgi:hypothetical protein